MWKLTSWGFRKCGSFWRLELLNHSYQPPKSGQNPEKKFRHRACHKKLMRAQFFFKSLFLLREVFKWYLKNPLRRNKLFFKNWASIIFFLTSGIFRDEPTFADLSWLWAAITIFLIICTPMWPTYSESWVRALSHGTTHEKIFTKKFSRRGGISKKHRFWPFFASTPPQQSKDSLLGQFKS